MAAPFFEQPILNNPYSAPSRHHALDEDGQPLDRPPMDGRRRSEIITPVPMPKKRKGKAPEPSLALGELGEAEDEPEYKPYADYQRNPRTRRQLARTQEFRRLGRDADDP